MDNITSDPSRKGAARDVLVIVFDQDAVVPRQDRQVGHSACPILVVHTADVCLRRTLNGQGQTTYKNMMLAVFSLSNGAYCFLLCNVKLKV